MGIDGGWDLVKCMEAEAPRKPFFHPIVGPMDPIQYYTILIYFVRRT
jgi:hypothetical protein